MGRMSSTPDAVFAPSVRVRGTLALVAGRDETAEIYRRFGTRLSADGYTVGVFAGSDAGAASTWLAAQDDAPRVLVGSDTGAAAVLGLLAREDAADAAIVAGLPVDLERTPADAERTACPVHLGVLRDARVEEHNLQVPEPVEGLSPADLAAIAVPVLAVHGGADPVSPFADAREVLAALPDLDLIETVDGLHDALNDQSHRSVAATIVLWLERLRAGDVRAPLVRPALTASGVEVPA